MLFFTAVIPSNNSVPLPSIARIGVTQTNKKRLKKFTQKINYNRFRERTESTKEPINEPTNQPINQ